MAVNDLRTRLRDRFRPEFLNKRRYEDRLYNIKAIENNRRLATLDTFRKKMADCYDVEMLIAIADSFQDKLSGDHEDKAFKDLFHAELEAWLGRHKVLQQQLAIVIQAAPMVAATIIPNTVNATDPVLTATRVEPSTVHVKGKALLAKIITAYPVIEGSALGAYQQKVQGFQQKTWTGQEFLCELAKADNDVLIGLVKGASKKRTPNQRYLIEQQKLIKNKLALAKAKATIFRVPFFGESRERTLVKKFIQALRAHSGTAKLTIASYTFDRNELLVLIRADANLCQAFRAELARRPWFGQPVSLDSLFSSDEHAKNLFKAEGDDYSASAEALLPSLQALPVVRAVLAPPMEVHAVSRTSSSNNSQRALTSGVFVQRSTIGRASNYSLVQLSVNYSIGQFLTSAMPVANGSFSDLFTSIPRSITAVFLNKRVIPAVETQAGLQRLLEQADSRNVASPGPWAPESLVVDVLREVVQDQALVSSFDDASDDGTSVVDSVRSTSGVEYNVVDGIHSTSVLTDLTAENLSNPNRRTDFSEKSKYRTASVASVGSSIATSIHTPVKFHDSMLDAEFFPAIGFSEDNKSRAVSADSVTSSIHTPVRSVTSSIHTPDKFSNPNSMLSEAVAATTTLYSQAPSSGSSAMFQWPTFNFGWNSRKNVT